MQSQTIRKDGTESKTPRYVVTKKAGYFKPLKAIENRHGEIVMYYQANHKCNPNSTAETRLQCKGSVNFSSLYFDTIQAGKTLFAFGEPPQSKKLKSDKENPFFENRADGYLFIVAPDQKTIEILIIKGGRQLIRGYLAQLADGQLNEALEQIRKQATSYSNM